jgi:hypothetical protein
MKLHKERAFAGCQEMQQIDPVVLTDEEQQECQTMLHSLLEVDGGDYVMKEELIDSFKRSVVALCMMGRAERFLIMAGCGSLNFPLSLGRSFRPEYIEKACEAAAKACGTFPVSIYFYDFACVLRQTGKLGEAKQMFAEFLRRHGTESLDPIMHSVLNLRDVDQALHHARELTT